MTFIPQTTLHLSVSPGLFLAFVSIAVWGQPSDLGDIEFPTSGSPAAQGHFLRGVLLLHSFEYDDARESFLQAQRTQPDFAMAYWGEAMTYNHPVWVEEDPAAARSALKRLANTSKGRVVKAPTVREKDYLRTVEILYGQGDKKTRHRAYAEAMRLLWEKYPDDLEAAAFYALALLGTSTEGRQFPTYMKAAAVAEEVFQRKPRHPGALHYLIHSYDDPVHAPLGLRAARAYADVAPAAPHALHMPSHIYFALGMWDDAVRSNEASWEAAKERVERKQLSTGEHGYHALWWLQYAYLQQGRYREALKGLSLVARNSEESSISRVSRHFAYMRAAYVIETRQWQIGRSPVDSSKLNPATLIGDLFVIGFSAANTGDEETVHKCLEQIRSRRWSTLAKRTLSPGDAQAAEIMEQQLEATLKLKQGKSSEALQLLRRAASSEDTMFFFGPPIPFKPSHELMGEVLLELGQNEAAKKEFELALVRTPKRALSLLGLARAAAGSGDLRAAKQAYVELEAVWQKADSDLAELKEIRGYLTR